jgi:hypothetical protein
MKKLSDLSTSVANLVYTPTLVAYVWIIIHWVKSGVGLYLIARFVAYKRGAFERYESWPTISKVVLYFSGPFLILGLFFSTKAPAYSMLIPLYVNGLLSVAAGLALRRLDSRSEDPRP